jgi:membrane protease YdiL (CAAX protease family)
LPAVWLRPRRLPMCEATTSVRHRLDAAAVLLALVLPTLLTLVYFVWLAEGVTWLKWTVYGGGKIVQFAFPLVWVLAVRRRRLGLRWPGWRGLPESIAFAALVVAAMLLLYHGWLDPAGHMDASKQAIGDVLDRFEVHTAARYLAMGAFVSVLNSLLEEYYWRWFVFGELRRWVPLWAAVLVSGLGFMAHHVLLLGRYFGGLTAETVLFSLAVAAGGAVWAWIYHRSGSLLGPWLSHMLVDTGIFLVGYQMLSGSLGP